jgi:hypothetical protein
VAYKNLVNQNCVGFTEEAFQRMRDFICKRNGTYDYSTTGIGWTLHDSYYATNEDNCAIGDWFVVKSVGESGKEDLYCRFKWHEADHFSLQAMLYWNAGTDTGYKKYPTSGNYYVAAFGCACDLPYDTTVAICSGALNSGSDISITVDIDLPSEWAVNRYLFIRDTAEIDKIKIKTLNAGTKTITADLAHSFLAGSKLCADLLYHCSYSNTLSTSPFNLMNHDGAELGTVTRIITSISSYSNPDEMNDEPIGEFIHFGVSSIGYMGKMKNICKIGIIPGVNSEDVYTDVNSTDWRVFNAYNAWWVVVKEV